MSDFFIAGGFGMYPTLLAGLCLLGTCLQYARRPEQRFVPLMVALGLCTLIAGGLGFVTGVGSSITAYTGPFEGKGPIVLLLGFHESLNNVVLALLLSMVSALFASVGAWRLSRQLLPTSAAAR